ncbi:AI-2E family transporter [Cellulomonas sp. ATA003]|uniref:AI-2E family transporter n=1 Tax=Cellulomonas sp. ATA003 TaxID=3073064 RepID=UPI002872C784|nr:AI-2E family transporter [Cellulomonas sp. ATA003]WNB85822.1 AI-2E family transporter [Cellulomonas sp. ATA003]
MANPTPTPVSPATGRPIWQDFLGRTAIRSAQLLLVLVLTSVVVYALTQLKLIVIPVLIAAIIAAAVAPLVRWLRRRGVPNGLATWIALLLGGGTLGVVVWLVVRGIRNGWDELAASASEGLDELQAYLTDGPLEITEDQIDQARDAATDLLASDQVTSGAIAGATAVAEVLAGMFLGAVVLFFLIKDGRRIWEFFLQPLDAPRTRRAHRIGDRSVDVLGGYVRGTAIVATVDAVVIGIALVILGVPLALPLATVVFLGAFIPLVGATVAGILAGLVALVSNGPTTALIVLGVVVLVNQLEGDLLQPVVMGKALSLHPLAILIALTAGTILSGILGALLAVPIAAVAWTVVKEWNAPDDEGASPDRVTAVAT